MKIAKIGVRDFALSTPPGLSRWIEDWWPATAAYPPMAAAGLFRSRPRGAAIDGPADNRRSTGTSPAVPVMPPNRPPSS